MAHERSVDVVSQVDRMDVINALQQARKDVSQRFDFKNTAARIQPEAKDAIVLTSDELGLWRVRLVPDI